MAGEASGTNATSLPFEAFNQRGERLVGVIDLKQPGTREVCVMVHGLLCNRDVEIVGHLGKSLDFNTCRFDLSGNGDSEGTFSYAGYAQETQDVRTVVERLRGEGWEVRAILGHSKGGIIALMYAWEFDDVPMVITLGARFDFRHHPTGRFSAEQLRQMQEQGLFVYPLRGREWVVRREHFDEREALELGSVAKIKRTHVHICHGDEDEIVPFADARALASHLKCQHTLHVLEGATHSLDTPPEVETVRRVVGGIWESTQGA